MRNRPRRIPLASVLWALSAVVPCAAQNLVVNGGFEEPVLADVSFFIGLIPGWTSTVGTGIEIQAGGGWGLPYEGRQLVELDSQSPSNMFQDISTKTGESYQLSVAYTPRPGVASNEIDVFWDGVKVDTLRRDGTENPDCVWEVKIYRGLRASTDQTRLEFNDCGLADSLGGYLDDVRVESDIPPDCNENGMSDWDEIQQGTGKDCNGNGVLDECDVSQGTSRDCNGNGILDECDLGLELGFVREKDIPSPPSPDNPIAVAVGDFSSDGKPDLAFASAGAKCISVLLRLESGDFFAEPPLVLENAPTFLVAAELSGDGHLDLVASTKGDQDNLHVFLGSGNATFPQSFKHTFPGGARCIAPADLDGDGDTDLAIASEGALQVPLLFNAGDATLRQSAVDVDEVSSWITAADFTGDRKPDLAFLRGQTGFLTVLKNLGDGTFEPGLPVKAGSSTSLPRCMAAGDWDGDGDQDLAVALEGTSSVAILAGRGDGTLGGPKNLVLDEIPIFVASRDLDFDGRAEVVTASSAALSTTVLRNAGGLTIEKLGPFTAGKGASFVALADLVGTAAPDLLVVNSDADSLSVVRNTFSPPIEEDCDSNGALDSCDIASGAAKDCNSNGIPDSCDIASGVLVDANNDGIPDSCQGSGTRYLRADANSDGKGDIADAIFALVYLFSGGPKPGCLDATDITDDGKVDITDPIFFLAYLFAGGLRPSEPFGACGADPTEDGLDCAEFVKCP